MMETKTNLLDRELSWLDFNARVLEEAYEKENPLMSGCVFSQLLLSNLDEFYDGACGRRHGYGGVQTLENLRLPG